MTEPRPLSEAACVAHVCDYRLMERTGGSTTTYRSLGRHVSQPETMPLEPEPPRERCRHCLRVRPKP